jgi:hypothetical protein
MRAVEARLSAFMDDGDPGTVAFDNFTSRCSEEAFYSSPFNVAGNRIGKNGGQYFLMLTVHD